MVLYQRWRRDDGKPRRVINVVAINTKPVKECRGCALNLGKRCAVFEQPVLKWKKKCEGFNNPALIAQYEQVQHPKGARARKEQRKQRAALAHTVVHSDGVHRLGRVR